MKKLILIMTLLSLVSNLKAEDIQELKTKLAKAEAIEQFKNSIISSNWDKALNLCSKRIKAIAAKSETKKQFFSSYVFLKAFNKNMRLSSSRCITSRSIDSLFQKIGFYRYTVYLSSSKSDITIEWQFKLILEKEKWVIDFNPIPIKEQINNLLNEKNSEQN